MLNVILDLNYKNLFIFVWVIIYGFTISLSVDIYANTGMASVIIMYLALREIEKEV